jgi:hypothetical protein
MNEGSLSLRYEKSHNYRGAMIAETNVLDYFIRYKVQARPGDFQSVAVGWELVVPYHFLDFPLPFIPNC